MHSRPMENLIKKEMKWENGRETDFYIFLLSGPAAQEEKCGQGKPPPPFFFIKNPHKSFFLNLNKNKWAQSKKKIQMKRRVFLNLKF